MTEAIDFATLGLSSPVLKAITNLGYEQPSPIQSQAIPHLLAGKNLLGVAQTGTGKTAAFALPLLSRVDAKKGKPQVLVLAPTRELAIQVAEAFQSYARHIKNFHVTPIYGGQDIRGQLRALQRGADVVVGTPGRILDHLRRRSLKLENLKTVVLDEADEMLRMGFIDDIETILGQAPEHCQRALFSATMPAAIRRVATKYIGDAEEVRIASKTRTVEKTEQQYLIVHHSHKLDTLTRILEVEQFDGMIVFVRTKSSTVELAGRLEARGFSAYALNGDLNQTLREKTINRFKRGDIDILVATDVAARGLDVERVSHVINFDIPYDTESYVHRIGRTGRAGREGKAILFVTPKERRLLHAIEKANRQQLKAMPVPTGEQVSQQRVERFQVELMENIQSQDLSTFRELIEQLAHDTETDIGEIAAALVWQAQKERPLFPKFKPLPDAKSFSKSEKRKPAKRKDSRRDDGQQASEKPRRRKKSTDHSDLKMVCYRIEAGDTHGVKPGDIVGALANEAGIDGEHIGHIDIHDNYSTVDLPDGMPKEIFQHLKKVRVRQQAMKISLANEDSNAGQALKKPTRSKAAHKQTAANGDKSETKDRTAPGKKADPKKKSYTKKKLGAKKKNASTRVATDKTPRKKKPVED
ncbi:MAG: ATP-dependent helicase [Gammaproteobacteria bacterium]|nr:MAG: ATP-dependent helicase [Gammaproteobacteria bacterium]